MLIIVLDQTAVFLWCLFLPLFFGLPLEIFRGSNKTDFNHVIIKKEMCNFLM